MPQSQTPTPLTGRKVFAITAGFFAVVIAVNITMAFQAVSTFPGLEVANSYVASQSFDRERTAQQALGWRLNATANTNEITLHFQDADGRVVVPQDVRADLGRATEARDDHSIDLITVGDVFRADVALEPGKWVLWISATAIDGTPFRKRLALHVPQAR